MSAAEGAYAPINELKLPTIRVDAKEISNSLIIGMKKTAERFKQLGQEQKEKWFPMIGKGAEEERQLAQFSAALIQAEDEKTRASILNLTLPELLPNFPRDKIGDISTAVAKSIENLRTAVTPEDVFNEITSLASRLGLSRADIEKLIKRPEILMATGGSSPWKNMEGTPPSPRPSLGGGSLPPPNPPRRNFMEILRNAFRSRGATARHYARLFGWAAAIALIGGTIIISSATVLGTIAENSPVGPLEGNKNIRDKIAATYAGYENIYDTELNTYAKIINGESILGWSVEKQLDFLRTSDDATRVASLAAFRTEMEQSGIKTYADLEVYLKQYYSGARLTELLIMGKYTFQTVSGFPDTHGFDTFFLIPTPTATPKLSPTPTIVPGPTRRLESQWQRQKSNKLTRDQKSRSDIMSRRTGRSSKGFT
ncbi:hypothetical protein HY030_03670 [Candidatus Gottesmanbacteria bacterium]|nr:hypothetical protein [Candidatus Gottesmanbacteria bacterium]